MAVVNNASNSKAELETALTLNKEMQVSLLRVKDKIEKLLKSVQDIYASNEEFMRKDMQQRRKRGIGMRGAYLKGGTFYLKGSMFFKDFDCRNCPDNPDYKRRKANNEMFPMDLDLQGRHVWSVNDKKGVVDGIKDQIIQHLNSGVPKKDQQLKELDSEKLVKLLQQAPADFRIDWNVISQHNVKYRHTAKSCEAIWNIYLHPSLKRCKWTEQENMKLLEKARKHNFVNWQAIAKDVGSRSDFQCFVQYQNYVCYMTSEKSNRWTKENDAKLIEVIERNTINGIINWSNVMIHFPHKPRTTLQCRYSYSLNPLINRAPFTPEEDLLLLATVDEYGTKFSCFPRTLFPNRTTVQLRSRYRNTLMHRHKQKSWTLEDDQKLMEFVAENGIKSWKQCETYVESHSRISCRTRYYVIAKFFKQNPDARLEDLPRKRQKMWNYVHTQNWTEKLKELSENPNAKLVKKCRKPAKKSEARIPRKLKPKEEKVKRQRIAKPRRKALYVERLRANGLKLYNSFKYAYNYELGRDPLLTTSTYDCSKLGFVKSCLKLEQREEYQFDDNVPTLLRPMINLSLRQPIKYEIPEGFSLPPSWSTCMAFRALCIHTVRKDLQVVETPDVDENNEHIQRFRARLWALFYTTALLSRVHPTAVGANTALFEHNRHNRIEFNTRIDASESCKKSLHIKSEPPEVYDVAQQEPKIKRIKLNKTKTELNIKEENLEL